jgi:hypothetical protein
VALELYLMRAPNFKELALDAAISSQLANYEEMEVEGRAKKDSCRYFNGNVCELFRVRDFSVSNWISQGRMDPHPIFCYACPYYSLESNGAVELSLTEIYAFYYKQRISLERELEWIDERISKMGVIPVPLGLMKRREGLIAMLEELGRKMKVITTLMRITKAL